MSANGWRQDFKDWATHPFSEDMPASHWFLLIGMILVFVVLWNIVLIHLIGAIKEL